jgi:hypothetical protein
MNLLELYKRLALDELSNHRCSGDGSGTIVSDYRSTVVSHLNAALRDLHIKFNLLEKSLILELETGKVSYVLSPQFSYQNATLSGKKPYIVDMFGVPFNDTVIRIIRVMSAVGHELPINDVSHPYSVFTRLGNIIDVPYAETGRTLAVTYQTFPKEVLASNEDASIDVPLVLEDAVRAYISYKVFSNINTAESNTKAQEHLQRYEAVCVQVEANDLLGLSSVTSHDKFDRKGWV